MGVNTLPIENSKHDVYDFIDPKHGMKDAAKGKTVLITGAGTGIGKAISTQFAIAGAASVILVGRRAGKLEETKAIIEKEVPDCQVKVIPADVTDKTSISNLFAQAGKVDVVINNAGAVGTVAPLGENLDDWWNAFEVNIKGTYLVSCEYIRTLAGGPGTIIAVSSVGSYSTAPGMSAYQSSKSALNRLIEMIDKEYSEQGVVAIAFHPGGIRDTEMTEFAPDWLLPLLIDTLALPAATAVYLSTSRAAFFSGRFASSNWDMEEAEKLKDMIVNENLLKIRVTGIDDFMKPQ